MFEVEDWAALKDAAPVVVMVLMILAFIILAVMTIRGNITSFTIGKDGLNVIGKNKRFQLATLNATLDKQIAELDGKMIDFAIQQADLLRRKLLHFLDDYIQYPFGIRLISAAIRHPLYHAARRNKFNIVLKPDNIQKYVNSIIEEIKLEYADVNTEQDTFECPIHQGKCMEFPEWKDMENPVRELLIKEWAYPVKDYRIKISQQKIELYENHIKIYEEMGDKGRVDIAAYCKQKNEQHIAGLRDRGDVL